MRQFPIRVWIAVLATGSWHNTATAQTSWRGLVVAPESRCSPYDADDYRYPQSVEDIAWLLWPRMCVVSIIIINPGLDSRARTALEHMLESVVSARGKVLRTNFSATSRVTRATKLTQAASRHSYRWCSPPTRGSATTFAVGDGRCVTVLKLGVSLFSPKWQRSS